MAAGAHPFVMLQRVLPKRTLTAIVHWLARLRAPLLRRALIALFVRCYAVDLTEAAEPPAGGYADFNDFFTRALRPGARPVAGGARTLTGPCDGTVSERGAIEGDCLLQARLAAKSRYYTLRQLLGDDGGAADFIGGDFATIYLAPYNYHRVHMPLSGTLTGVRHLPGTLFSVNAATAAALPGLFARNERVVCRFDTASGPLAVIFVGALNVGSISIVGVGDVAPRRSRCAANLLPPGPARSFLKGAELGRFNMGSTVILLLPQGTVSWQPAFTAGAAVRMGAAIGECRVA